MKYSHFGIAIVLSACLAGGATVAAQTASSTASKPQTTAPKTPKAAKASSTVKLTGCLEHDTTATPGAKAAASSTYKLSHLDAQAWKTALGTSSTMLGATDLTTLNDVQVKAGTGVDLKAHVDHKVELTGKVSEPAAKAGATTTPVLQATSLKMISTSCQ
jgi:hypothetical protein